MKIFVCSIALSEDYSKVVMLHKNRPENLAGKLNFPGGKVETDEHPAQAARREFEEETGVDLENWTNIATFSGENFIIYYYRAVSNNIFNVRTTTDEVVEIFPVGHILDERLLAEKYYPSLALNQPNSVMLSLALQKQIQYAVRFYWNGVRDNTLLGL